jgi:uncharacterized membrane protein YqjE
VSGVAAGGASPPRRRGLIVALADLAATMVAIAQTRLALMEVDLDQALLRLVVLLSWWAAALFAFGLAVAVGVAAAVLAVASEDRVAVLVGAAFVLLLFGAAAVAVALERTRRAPRWFAATLEELGKDHAILRAAPP